MRVMQTFLLIAVVGLLSSSAAQAALVEHHTFDNDVSDVFGRTTTAMGDAGISANAKVGGGALYVDGDDYVALASSAATMGMTEFTLAMWMNLSDPGVIYGTNGWPGETTPDPVRLFHFNQADYNACGVYVIAPELPTNNNEFEKYGPDDSVMPDIWVHVAQTYDGTEWKQYVDGVEVVMASRDYWTDPLGEPGYIGDLGLPSAIGGWDAYGVWGLETPCQTVTGYIDDMRIYDTALSLEEVLALPGVSSGELAGDYNSDGTVDQADYTVWADTYGQGADLRADGNGDEYIDQADYTIWADNYGAGGPMAVPEPATMMLLGLGGLAMLRRRK